MQGMRLNMLPIAGGNWNNGVIAGVWALNLNNSRTNSNHNNGFRADSASPSRLVICSVFGAKGDVFLPAFAGEICSCRHSGSASAKVWQCDE